MDIKGTLRFFFIFISLYLIIGISTTFILGNDTFFESVKKGDIAAIFGVLIWPIDFLVFSFKGVFSTIIGLGFGIILVLIIIWISRLIDKNLLKNSTNKDNTKNYKSL